MTELYWYHLCPHRRVVFKRVKCTDSRFAYLRRTWRIRFILLNAEATFDDTIFIFLRTIGRWWPTCIMGMHVKFNFQVPVFRCRVVVFESVARPFRFGYILDVYPSARVMRSSQPDSHLRASVRSALSVLSRAQHWLISTGSNTCVSRSSGQT